jgi:hypothetical protein
MGRVGSLIRIFVDIQAFPSRERTAGGVFIVTDRTVAGPPMKIEL